MTRMETLRNVEPRLVGGHVALDLINTVAPRLLDGHDHEDYLPEPADLLAWAQRVRIIEVGEVEEVARAWAASPALATQALRATIDVREAAYAALAATLAPHVADPEKSEPAMERLTLRWAAAAARSELVPDARAGGVARLNVGTAPGLVIPDRLATATVDLLTTVDRGQLRVCPTEEGGCGWLFLDRSRNGSRRWCAMADCGTQAKTRRLTARRRQTRASSKVAETSS
jgi:predicted RNA-binding Zn ribbon-like protein